MYSLKHKWSFITAIIPFALSFFFLTQVYTCKEDIKPVRVTYDQFAGSDKCVQCHKEIYDQHIQSAHYLTAKPVEPKWMKGSFEPGKNEYGYSPLIEVKMEHRDSGWYQVAYYKGEEKKAMRMDFVVGSAAKGQSFMTWRRNKLFQLPITYYTAADRWSNSPGYPPSKVVIDKPITSRCLECHNTYAEALNGKSLEPTEFNREKMILGVDCERCHGPSARHVEFQTKHPEEKTSKYTINPVSFTRQQKLDMCALCHGGNITKTKPSFEFVAGNNLADYFKINSLNEMAVNNGNIDVHGNQIGLLQASKCFKLSEMTCNTCHDAHKNERGQTAILSKQCITCHPTDKENFKTPTHKGLTSIEKNCIDCHMPAIPSRAITVQVQGEEIPRSSKVRSHFISIYPDETKKFIGK